MEAVETQQIETPAEAVDTDAAYAIVHKQRPAGEFKHNLFVLESLVMRDFKLKYRRSILGVLWAILNPLLMMVVMAAVFSYMFRFQIEN